MLNETVEFLRALLSCPQNTKLKGIVIQVETEDDVFGMYMAYNRAFMKLHIIPVEATRSPVTRDILIHGIPITIEVKK